MSFVLILHNYTYGLINRKIFIVLINVIKLGLIFGFSYFLNSFVNNYINYEAFCAMCIIESSVCIRVELRWVYASFVGFMIYISYIVQKAVNDEFIGKIQKIVVVSLFTVFFGSRVFLELYHHQHNDKIFLLYDLNVINSLANHTINKYGEEEILNKKYIY